MIYTISDFLISVIEAMGCMMFFEVFREKEYERLKFLWKAILVAVLAVSFNVVYGLYRGDFLLMEVVVIVVICAIMIIPNGCRLLSTIGIACLFQGHLLVVDYLTYSFMIDIMENGPHIDGSMDVFVGLISFIDMIVLLLSIMLLRHIFGKMQRRIVYQKGWLIFVLFPLFSIVTISMMVSLLDDITLEYQAWIIFFIGFGIVIMNFLVFFILRKTNNKAEKIKEEEPFGVHKKDQDEMCSELNKSIEKLRSTDHEFKNHISCLKFLADNGDYASMSDYLDKMIEWDTRSENTIDTNHVIVNAVLNTKHSEAVKKDIVFAVKVNDLSGLKIANDDLVIMLTNILSNAVEAAEKCDGERYIRLKMELGEEKLVLACENSFSHTLVRKGNLFVSTKDNDSESHGIGIKNVINVIEKYHGSYVIRDDQGKFLFSIIIPVCES